MIMVEKELVTLGIKSRCKVRLNKLDTILFLEQFIFWLFFLK